MHIFYLFCRCNPNPIRHYLAASDRSRFRHLTPVSYESLRRKRHFPPGAYIFTDIELLHGDLKRHAVDIHDRLAAAPGDYRLFNDPAQSLSRFPLLRTLWEQRLNDFNVYRALDDLSSVSFPVFLRRTDDHRGPQSELLNDRRALRARLERLAHSGEDLAHWLVTEFCNVRDQDGLYHKYSAFRVGAHILPRHLFFGKDWMLKHTPKELPAEILTRERAYLAENPYADQVLSVFETARISYGRIDFGILNGRVQTWEVNSNPMVCTRRQFGNDPRRDIHTLFMENFHRALDEIIGAGPHTAPGLAYAADRWKSGIAAAAEAQRYTALGRLWERVAWRWERMRKRK